MKNCEKHVFTDDTPNKTLTAWCPLENDEQMKICLNWRRNDSIGFKGFSFLDEKSKMRSLKNFCLNFPNSEDCKCINRNGNHEYQILKFYFYEPDHCWYETCSSDKYLDDRQHEYFNCYNGIICKVNLENNFHNMSSCGNVSKNLMEKVVDDDIYILLLLILFCILIFKLILSSFIILKLKKCVFIHC